MFSLSLSLISSFGWPGKVVLCNVVLFEMMGFPFVVRERGKKRMSFKTRREK